MKKKILLIFWWSFWIIYLELIYRCFIVGQLFTKETFTVILFSIPWIILFSILSSLFKKEKTNRIISYILLIIITVITLAQIVYFNFYDSIFSFFSLTTGAGQVMQFWTMIIEVILRIWYIFVLTLVPFILFFVFAKKIFKFNRINMKYAAVYVLLIVLSFSGIVLVVNKDKDNLYSLKRLIFSTHAPMLTISKTGLYTMQAIDIERYLFGFEEEILIEEEPVVEKPVVEEEIEYNVYDINFDELIEKSKNKKVTSLHKYFKNVEPTKKNEYTGIFKDKNLIFITAEAFDAIAIDEEITPTLYKMANNGFVFKNYYQPLYPVSTSDGEYMNLTSLIPKEGVWSFSKSSSISMPFGFGTMFKKYGYSTYGFHNHNYKYYDRNKSHTNIGLKFYGCGNGLQKKMNCNHWPNSDYEMMQVTPSYYMEKDKPFATYYMTVSGHLNYNFYGNNMASRNKSKVKKLKYSDAVKAYFATQIELDKAMKLLLDTLEENGKLNDTLIVICPDHYPYGLTKDQLNEVSEINRKNKFENYHTALIMYNPLLETTIIDKTVCGLDILPTLYNLFGIEYDSRLLMGRDIFSDSDHIVILSDRSWITDKGKYNSVNKKFYKSTDEEVDEEYVKSINSIVNKRFSTSALILDNNYYSKLGLGK